MVHLTKNTSKEYKCVQCGSSNANIIREGDNPRLKCNQCNFMFDADASKAAEKAGAIPDGPPKLQEAPAPVDNPREPVKGSIPKRIEATLNRVPRNPGYVFISKDRKETEFVTKKDLISKTLKWESSGKNYDLFELTAKSPNVKVSFEE